MVTYSDLLKEWRKHRRMSQLDLALEADVSARHISFLETGRSRPSSEMIVHLSDVLNVPLDTRNAMMRAVGFAPKYRATPISDTDMAPIRSAVDWTLARHAPYPGIVLDRIWTIVKMNRPAAHLFAQLGLVEGGSLLDLVLQPHVPQIIENWPEVAYYTCLRLRAESASAGGIAALDAAAAALAQVAQPPAAFGGPTIPAVYRFGTHRLSLFATIAQFSTVSDETLIDLKIELFFPADDDSDTLLRGLAEGLC